MKNSGLIAIQSHPGLLLVALENGLAQPNLAMAIGECWVEQSVIDRIVVDDAIDRPKELFESIRKSFSVASRIAGVTLSGRGEQRRIADQLFVRSIPVANAETIGFFAIPGQRAFRARNRELEAILLPGCDLRYAQTTPNPIGKA